MVIDWNNPITRGLVLCAPLSCKAPMCKELVLRKNVTYTGAITKLTSMGMAAFFAGATTTDRLSLGAFAPNATYRSIAIIFKADTIDTVARRLWEWGAATATTELTDNMQLTNALFAYGAGWSTTTGQWNLGTIPTTGKWYQLVITYDGSSTANVPRAYLNGSEISVSVAAAPDGSLLNAETSECMIGNRQAATFNRPFSGLIASYLRWNRLLTPTEVMQLYTNPWCIYVRPFFSRIQNVLEAVVGGDTNVSWRSLLGVGK